MFAQINYQQKLGNSNLTLAEAGCFVTAFCNLLEDIGQVIAPPDLDAFFQSHGVFSYDFTDRANDDLKWNSITSFNSNIVSGGSVTGGWPQSNFAIVEFRYKSHTGATVTHFCKVADWQKQLIVDSWDGQTKSPGMYGQPIAYSVYKNNTPVATATSPPVVSSVSGRRVVTVQPNWGLSSVAQAAGFLDAGTPARWAAIAALNGSNDWKAFNNGLKAGDQVVVSETPVVTTPAPTGLPPTLYLPASVSVWHVYDPKGPYTLPHAIHILSPSKFGGLTYAIVGNPAPHVFLIDTEMYGRVAIYAGPDTEAQFPQGGHGSGESQTSPDLANGNVPVSEVVPAPNASLPVAEVPEPQLEPFATSMNLLTKNNADPESVTTKIYNPATGEVTGAVPVGTKFKAIGKYDNQYGVFFGDGKISVKTVDLEPDPNPDQESKSAEGEAQKVDVRVVPPSPDAWKRTFQRFMQPIEYRLKVDSVFHNLDNSEMDSFPAAYKAGTKVMVGGKFEKDNVKYYRAQSSIDKDTWYGLPIETLQRVGDLNDDLTASDLFDYEEAEDSRKQAGYAPKHEKVLSAAATTSNITNRLFHRSKK